MSGPEIATLILVGVGCLAVVAYIAQSIENAKEERRRRILLLQERTRLGWNLITELPPTYLPVDIRQTLLNHLKQRYQEILSIDAGNGKAKAQIRSIEELAAQPYTSKQDSPEPIFTDLMTAKNTASRVKDMVNFLVAIHKEGSLDTHNAQKMIRQGKALYALIKTDINQLTARQVEASNNPKLALAHYRNCRTRLEPFNSKGQMSQRIRYIDQRIAALKGKVEAEQQTETLVEQQDQKLQEEWKAFDQEGDWKMKQEYE